MNRNKQGETGRSECEVTKTRYLEAEELRDMFEDDLVFSIICVLEHIRGSLGYSKV